MGLESIFTKTINLYEMTDKEKGLRLLGQTVGRQILGNLMKGKNYFNKICLQTSWCKVSVLFMALHYPRREDLGVILTSQNFCF